MCWGGGDGGGEAGHVGMNFAFHLKVKGSKCNSATVAKNILAKSLLNLSEKFYFISKPSDLKPSAFGLKIL